MKVAILLSAILICAGCVPPRPTQKPFIRTMVDSITGTGSAGKSRFVVLPGLKDVESTDLQFQEFSSYVEMAMTDQGYQKVEKPEEADFLLFLTYGIGEPQERLVSYTVPTWGQTGVSGSYTTGSVSAYGNQANYFGMTTYTPTYGITGAQTVNRSVVLYKRFVALEAVDRMTLQEKKKIVPIWKTSGMSMGSSGDLRYVFPFMISAIKPNLATNTGRSLDTVREPDDPYVERLRSKTR